MARSVSFFAPGIPAPGGSKRGFVHKSTGRAIITEDCKRSKPWRSVVAMAAQEACRGELFSGPVAVNVVFQFPRPKGHYGSGKNSNQLRASAPPHHIVKPDATKLWRSTEDALKGIAWKDDSQIVAQAVSKVYGTPGAQIFISEVED
jgi:Holliday junction resolvase RusA-like endonuclease